MYLIKKTKIELLVALLLGNMISLLLKNIFIMVFTGKSFSGRSLVFQVILYLFLSIILVLIIYSIIIFFEKKFRLSITSLVIGNPIQIFFMLVVIAISIIPIRYIFNYINFPNIIEYREIAPIYAAINFAKGINPYIIQNYPEGIYLYGILYPVFLSIFLNPSWNPIIVARVFNFIFLVLFIILSFWFFRQQRASILTSSIGILILLYSTSLIWSINGTRPDIPGIFFAYICFIPLFNKNINIISLLMIALSSGIGFYIKQYSIFPILILIVYIFLFISKKKAFILTCFILSFILVSFLVINYYFPLYFEYTIIHYVAQKISDFKYMVGQTLLFIRLYWFIIILYAYFLHRSISGYGRQITKRNITININNINNPFIQGLTINVFDIGILISVFILSLLLGPHQGNWYVYYGEILLPPLLYVVIPKIDSIFRSKYHRHLVQLLIVCFCLLPFPRESYTDFAALNNSFLTLNRIEANCHNIYDESPLASSYKIINKMNPIYNNGQTEYAITVVNSPNSFLSRFTSYTTQLKKQKLQDWYSDIKTRIKNQEFDCIYTANKNEEMDHYIFKKSLNILGYPIYFYQLN